MIRALAILTAVLAVIAGPAVASANPRYASPTNQGTGDCMSEANSCDLRTAILNAGSGDDVYVRADLGDYSPGSGMSTPSGGPIHIHGLHGRPRILFNNGGLGLQAGTADNLYLENTNGGATAFALRRNTSGDRIVARAGGYGNACGMDTAKLTNSVCWAGSAAPAGVDAEGSNTLRNDTVIGGTTAAMLFYAWECENSCPETDTDTLVNVIARSGSGAPDISACAADGTAIAQVNVSHSNYATATSAASGCIAAMGHVTSDGTNQTAAPLFANAGSGNFHQKPGSPTIDKGIKVPANGTNDFEGDPRSLGVGTDIGADEARSPSITITRPAEGAHYKLGQSVTANFKCLDRDGPADIALCKGTVASGLPVDTASAGRRSFTVQARDKAGFKTAKTVHYTVDTAETTPPVVTGLPGDQRCVPQGLKLRISVHPTRLKQALVFLDGKQIARSTTPKFQITVKASQLKPGRHTVMIERDYKSGTKRRSTFSFSSCKGGGRSPHIRTQGTPDRGSCTANAFKMILTITGAVPSSVTVKLDGKSLPKPGKTQFTLTINVPALARGVHHVTITAADKFNNGSVDVTDFVRC
ncbi:MAG TPA: choice-of-anchor Q domain-containing protein [Thermoleophilaceae bacterium]|nr:choice-of-anchor Q domain-containing protein [Thermoleophilaceae bacterium]